MGKAPSFFVMFSKRDNFRDFLFAYLQDELFPKYGLHLKVRIAAVGVDSPQSFVLVELSIRETTPHGIIFTPSNCRVALQTKDWPSE